MRKFRKILYGGDYNPDQWSEDVWKDDIKYMKEMNVNVITLGIYSWANIEIEEGKFNFEWLDKIMNMMAQNDIYVILATPTAAVPPWLYKKYPDILSTTADGLKKRYGARNNFCPNSMNYRIASRKIASKLAERYKNHSALLMWHINNEYGNICYCDKCREEFRNWLKNKYRTIEVLNKKWNTNVWSHRYNNWDEIEVPSRLTELYPNGLGDRDASFQPAMAIDYNRFMSDSILKCYINEVEAVKKYTPDIPVTTNIPRDFKTLDLFSWGPYLDIMAWDNYPSNQEMESKYSLSLMALKHDIIRGIKEGKPFLLMEQTPSQQNWLPYNTQKRPGIMKLWSYQAIARGSNSVIFFQWRQSKSGFEKFHAAMISHVGHVNTRIGRELTQLGLEIDSLPTSILNSEVHSKVGIIFDWPNWWAVEYSSGPNVNLKYMDQIMKYHKAFYDLNIPVDIISKDSDFTKYDLIIAPAFYMVGNKTSQKLEEFVKLGGIFITTYFSGIVDENDSVILGGYPGAFRNLLGIWVEETDALLPGKSNSMVFYKKFDDLDDQYDCNLVCDVVHCEGAEPIAYYGCDYYKDTPCITENIYGKGKAIYIASEPDEKLILGLIKHYCRLKGMNSLFNVPQHVEVMQRKIDGKVFTFILNYNEHDVVIELPGGNFHELICGKYYKDKINVNKHGVIILENTESLS